MTAVAIALKLSVGPATTTCNSLRTTLAVAIMAVKMFDRDLSIDSPFDIVGPFSHWLGNRELIWKPKLFLILHKKKVDPDINSDHKLHIRSSSVPDRFRGGKQNLGISIYN